MTQQVSNTPLPELKNYLNEYHTTNGKMVHSEISLLTNFREIVYDKRSNHSANIYDGMYDIKYHDYGISLIDKPAKLLKEFGSDRRFLSKIFKDADAVYKSEKFIQYQKLPQLKSNPVMNSFENSVTAKLQTRNWFKKINSMKMKQSFGDKLRQEQNLGQTDLDELRSSVSIRSKSQNDHFVSEKLTTIKSGFESFEQTDKFFVTE